MKQLFFTFFVLCTTGLLAQYTLIPDSGFEFHLVIKGIDSDGEVNGQVLTSDIENLIELDLSEPYGNFTDLTGIEDFTALEVIDIYGQDIAVIDLSYNVNLIRLELSIQTEVLHIENNINLKILRLAAPSLNEIDLSNNINLEEIVLRSTLLTEIDMSSHATLIDFRLIGNHSLQYVNLQNGNNGTTLIFVEINFSNENVICVQVDDPLAVIEGNPPYEYWEIDESITISDNCEVFSVDDFELNSLFTLYPNPVQDVLTIENNSNFLLNTIMVYDVLGRLVLQENNPTAQLDVSNVASGLLFVQLETDKGVLVKKILKE